MSATPPDPPRRPPPPPDRQPPLSPPGATAPWSPPQVSGLAIASLALGIMWIFWLGSAAAVILGHVARRQIRDDPTRLTGAGLATSGLVLGYIGLAILLILIFTSAVVTR